MLVLHAVGAGVAANVAVMGVGMVVEGPMVGVGVAVVGIAKGWQKRCVVCATVSWPGAPLLLSGDCRYLAVGASGVDTDEWLQYVRRKAG